MDTVPFPSPSVELLFKTPATKLPWTKLAEIVEFEIVTNPTSLFTKPKEIELLLAVSVLDVVIEESEIFNPPERKFATPILRLPGELLTSLVILVL
ncbi:hypothetical protein TUM19329_17650 [Legionella antarctica]|uniref:Uncharacterized protein n=1 Tax=Legionella antarctica TaxID=2708020 RepID=A0A6F8T3Z0_9GAMM|nr:hypothetical protein TUM19329_17650 [Legionella antarctica]